VTDPFDAGPQPGGRAPAPGPLGLVQAYATTFFDLDAHGAEVWPDPAAYAAWLAARGIGGGGPVTAADLRDARALREVLRALAYANHAGRPPGPALAALDRHAALAAGARTRFGPQGPRLEPSAAGHAGAAGLVCAVVGQALGDGSWSRLKACPGPGCGWLFWDGSRNRSAQWCAMAVCGNRVKGRAFRQRLRHPPAEHHG
jgi:predicted RNA-binding Zn ribbon-like protein